MTAERERDTLSDMTAQTNEVYSTSRWVAAGLRAEIARAGLSQSAVAARIGVSEVWLSRRLSQAGKVDLTLEDVDLIAGALGLNGVDLIVDSVQSRAALRAHREQEALQRARRDSNPKPSDLWPSLRLVWSVKPGLTPNRQRTVDRTEGLRVVS